MVARIKSLTKRQKDVIFDIILERASAIERKLEDINNNGC